MVADGADAERRKALPLTVEDTREIEDEHARRASLPVARIPWMSATSATPGRFISKSIEITSDAASPPLAAATPNAFQGWRGTTTPRTRRQGIRGVTDNPRGYIMVYHHAGGRDGTSPSVDFFEVARRLGPSRTDTLKCVLRRPSDVGVARRHLGHGRF